MPKWSPVLETSQVINQPSTIEVAVIPEVPSVATNHANEQVGPIPSISTTQLPRANAVSSTRKQQPKLAPKSSTGEVQLTIAKNNNFNQHFVDHIKFGIHQSSDKQLKESSISLLRRLAETKAFL